MGQSRASKDQLHENGCQPKNNRYAAGELVDSREQDFRNALNYEMHAEGDSVGKEKKSQFRPRYEDMR